MLLFLAPVLLLVSHVSSQDTALHDAEVIQKSLAAVNLRHFSRTLLHEALFPNREPDKPVSCQSLRHVLGSAAGQDAARVAAMRSILTHYSRLHRGAPWQARARQGEARLLTSVCYVLPWLSWLVDCGEEQEQSKLPGHFELAPLNLTRYQWATCRREL